ncbi:hypothetical protein U8P76_10785 [Rhizobium johnstonii]|uniref:hypothetical protein n=1 Tax=Rhizobium leguminosarum TaxID=384 RepID=UPI001031764B|nr:hypothetical protein [Rhizobium leguminosarum]TBG20634.1 hypothetical protein ELG81_08745 [Rhizobium leguminosarum]TBG46550.1 hypothetical protein ELG75_08760 [Rhizobium leguminosarum]TBG79521.1 hypothetical protein ELG76_09095 [Rhizobium leguminosarum]WSG97235.1 hypothetical protein U8P76_10785 [Rhizobium johnstonii]
MNRQKNSISAAGAPVVVPFPQIFHSGVGPIDVGRAEASMLQAPELRREGGYLFLIVNENNRLSIATTIEALIDLMDACEDDPDFEPTLGAPEQVMQGCWSLPAGGLDECEIEPSGYADFEGMLAEELGEPLDVF